MRLAPERPDEALFAFHGEEAPGLDGGSFRNDKLIADFRVAGRRKLVFLPEPDDRAAAV